MLKRIVLLLAVTALVAVMLFSTAGLALAAENGKGNQVGGGDTFNQKDVKAEKTRTGGGPLNNPHVTGCTIGCTPS